jgi:hypothetical protein
VCANTIVAAQVVYDWKTKTLESSPKIHRSQVVRFKIENVNDILFKYSIEVTQTPISSDGEWGIISQFMGLNTQAGGNAAANACTNDLGNAVDLLKQVSTAISNDAKLPAGYANSRPHSSVPLKDSLDAWASHRTLIGTFTVAADEARSSCAGSPSLATFEIARKVFDDSVRAIENKVNSSHEFISDVRVSAGNDISVAVRELFNTEEIDKQKFSFSGVDILTLSAGALFTAIPDRSYESRKTPNSTENVLAVEGNSRATPAVVALLNYSLGSFGLDREAGGLALSAGPVVRFGTQGTSSSFGFFTGLSAHLRHRIYFTPGVHFGQFADFPVGFSNGSTIPANFGELTPVKRWTTRFGFAITFKTKDFSGLGSSSSVKAEESNGKTKGTTSLRPQPGTSSESSSALVSSLNRLMPTSSEREFRAAAVTLVSDSSTQTNEIASARLYERSLETNEVASPRVAVSYDPAVKSTSNQIVIMSLKADAPAPERERIAVSSSLSINDYSIYFRNGRFFIVFPQVRLDVLHDELRGVLFRDPVIERCGENTILSFVLTPGGGIRVAEKPYGLDILITSPDVR